jgi:diguanylate cyclase (GGDEF)-like protein
MSVRIVSFVLTFLISVGLCLGFSWQAPIVIGVLMLTGIVPLVYLLISEKWARRADACASWAFFQRVLDLIPYPVYIKDAQSRYLLVNRAQSEDKFRSPENLIGKLGLSSNATAEAMYKHFEEDGRILAGEKIFKEEHKRHFYTGEDTFRIISKEGCRDAWGEPVIVGIHFNITELRQAQRSAQAALERETALREQMQQFVQRLMDVIADPLYIKTAEGRFLMVNDAYVRYKGVARDVIVSEAYPPPPNAFNAQRRQRSLEEDQRVLAGEDIEKEEHLIHSETGEEIFRIVCKRRSCFFDNTPVVIGIDKNITRWKIAERELLRQAQEDALTGIANRRHFSAQAEAAIKRAERYQEAMALAIIDLDHFKRINDQYGHHAGDQVLRETVLRLLGGLRDSDLIGRWGGEEFVLLLPYTGSEDAVRVTERLRTETVESAMCVEEISLHVSFSAGVAQYCHGDSLDELVARADAALYEAKAQGRNRIVMAPMPSASAGI